MNANRLRNWAVTVSTGMVLAFQAKGQQPVVETQLAAQAPAHQRVIVVSLEDRKLALIEDGDVKKIYTVAVGKPSTPSPSGTFTIARRIKNPVYHHDGKTVQPGPGNPVGTRWMGLSIRGYGIHGTNIPKSIGKAASHGCIRMGKADIEELFEQVQVGDRVELIGQRNEETAQWFSEPKPAPTGQPSILAAAPVSPSAPAAETATSEGTADGVAVAGSN